jgi:hypothetical protein
LQGKSANRDFPEQPPVSFNLDIAGVLEPYYKLAQFIKPTELAKDYEDFAFMVDRAKRFLSTPEQKLERVRLSDSSFACKFSQEANYSDRDEGGSVEWRNQSVQTDRAMIFRRRLRLR